MLISFKLIRNTIFISFCVFAHQILFAQNYSIGHTSLSFVDAARNNRDIPVEIYYPADQNGEDVPVAVDCFPVISFGHGFVMMSGAYQNIWEALVPEGYIMVFVDSETGFNVSHGDYGMDLAFVVDEMLSLNNTSGALFEDSVCGKNVVMGHSMGGGAGVLALANSNNINGYIGLAPAETTPSAISGAATSMVPSLIFSGTSDGVTPPADHHIPIYNGFNSDCKTIVNITGGAHCYYANLDLLCDIGEGAASTGITLTRVEQQAIMIDYLIPWLEYLNVTDDFSAVENELIADERITFESNCFVVNTDESFKSELNIYPNPARDVVFINNVSDELVGEMYNVIDLLGNVVLTGRISHTHFSLDLGKLTGGVYYLRIDGVGVERWLPSLVVVSSL